MKSQEKSRLSAFANRKTAFANILQSVLCKSVFQQFAQIFLIVGYRTENFIDLNAVERGELFNVAHFRRFTVVLVVKDIFQLYLALLRNGSQRISSLNA